MKKFFILMIIIGICIGIFVATRENITDEPQQEEENNTEVGEVYIDELNLPLIEVDTLNPILTQNKQVSDTLKLIYEPLYDFDSKNKLVNKLAIEANEKDSLTWLIRLNDKATWHSGIAFNADDVIFTYNAILNSQNSVYKENIKNITAIEKLDDYDIQITLATQDKILPYKLTFPIIPKYYFENDLNNELKNNSPIGTGAYKYDTTSADGRIINLVANNKWWNNEPFKLNKIYLYTFPSYGEAIKGFKSNEVDAIYTSMPDWQKKFGAIGLNIYMYENIEFDTIIPNTQNEILSESSVRRMILSAINSDNVFQTILNGNGMASNYPLQSISYLNNYEGNKSFDIEKAKQLLINAGWTNSNNTWIKEINGKRRTLELNLLVNSDIEEKLEMANIIVVDLAEIGVKVNIVKAKTADYNARIENGNFEIALATINISNDINIIDLLSENSSKNYAKYKNDELQSIINNLNKDNVEDSFMQIQTIYKNEVPYIGMFYRCNNLLTNKSVKGNIEPTSWNVYNNITGWCK